MLARSASFLVLLASSAQAAPFDNLKSDLSTCLRFELDGARSHREVPATHKAEFAIQRCEVEIDRLDRADPRRIRSDHGLSPSTWSVIEGVFGRGNRGRFTGLLY